MPGGTTSDRQTYTFGDAAQGLSAGQHTLSFACGCELLPDQPSPQLCFVQVLEYGSAEEFRMQSGYIGAFPTWDETGREVYRPTRNDCLMRNMLSETLCPVCKQSVWMQLLGKVSLIDKVQVEYKDGSATATLLAPAVGQLRSEALEGVEEALEITWEQLRPRKQRFEGLMQIVLPTQEAKGDWTVTARYKTSEIRAVSDEKLSFTKAFKI
eukprot:TRINITY_DN45330_c0_g1_i1.p1 TRINITY_DN45330_c0_g1~~TRINITY_DN45330_c0_g1_i1.p1  ORF type:complete len:211 (+),score=58.55 TRINITY_DN45330_c0_g1_i1:222-854(+)